MGCFPFVEFGSLQLIFFTFLENLRKVIDAPFKIYFLNHKKMVLYQIICDWLFTAIPDNSMHISEATWKLEKVSN